MNWNPFKKVVSVELVKTTKETILPEFKKVKWTDEDALVYANFMSGSTGRKIRQIHDNKVVQTSMNACSEVLRDRSFQAGIAAGVMECGTMREVLCKTSAQAEAEAKSRSIEATPDEVQAALNELANGGAKEIDLGE